MTYYFSILYRRAATCTEPAREVRRAVAIEAEDVDVAHLFATLEHEYLWCEGGDFNIVQISKLHYETICEDLEIARAKMVAA